MKKEKKTAQDRWDTVRPAVMKLVGLKAQSVQIPMHDGVCLTATLYTPRAGNAWPVIVNRNPYVIGDISYLATTWKKFTNHGFAVLDVQVRGSQRSAGEWLPLLHEREDGMATIDWVGRQPWCNGNIGTYGGSYVGYTQWAILDYDHPMLKTHFISVFGNDPQQMFWHRGMFRQEVATMWAAQMMGKNRWQIWMGKGAAQMYRKAYSVKPQVELGEQLIGEPCDWYRDWVTTPDPKDPYWDEGTFGTVRRLAKDVKRPVCFQGGWYDIFLQMFLQGYRDLPDEVRAKSRIIVGPWEHHGMCSGDLKYPEGRKYGLLATEAALDWFDHHLKGEPLRYPCGMEAYCIGDGCWHQLEDDLISRSSRLLYFGRDTLEREPTSAGRIRYVYDPADPVESLGGNLIADNHNDSSATGPSSVRQLKPGTRADIITFLSPLLTEPLTLSGSIKVELYVSSSAPATAFTVKVSEVFANGEAFNIRDDITDIRYVDGEIIEDYIPGNIRKLSFDLADVYWKLQTGSKLRVDVSSSNFPAYHIHPNTTKVWGEEAEAQAAEQTIYFGGDTPSSITIPVE